MLAKTRGIVLRTVSFRETSVIVTLFTEQFGLQSYLINGVRSPAGRGKMALLQPLTLLELVAYHRESTSLKRLKEFRCYQTYGQLTSDIRRATLALFISEVLNKSLREDHHPAPVYGFLEQTLTALDTVQDGLESFHLVMMIGLSRFLGFGPNEPREVIEQAGLVLTAAEELKLKALLSCTYELVPPTSLGERQVLLEALLRFYRRHIDHFGEMKCIPVLREVLT
jgi:DNA repair protein RecO (recombination protein O)